MERLTRLIIVLVLVMALLPAGAARAQEPYPLPGDPVCIGLAEQLTAISGLQFTADTGMIGASTYCIIIPPGWGMPVGKSDLVVFAHGYVAPLVAEPYIPWNQLFITSPDGTEVNLPAIITGMGYAFATTSYSKNGLAVQEGVADVLALVDHFAQSYTLPGNVFLTGASEGGLVTTLAIEQHPEVFSAGLATCGPIGNFRSQINYWGDFRTVFDYFFPKLLKSPPSPLESATAIYIPDSTIQNWVLGDLQSKITEAVTKEPFKTAQLLSVTKAPIDLRNPAESKVKTILGILDYNIKATNEGRLELYGYLTQPPPDLQGSKDGNPFSNVNKRYTGSFNDLLLNKRVDRYQADPAALQALEAYQTTGNLQRPLVVMHTTGDEIVPYWHATLYTHKVAAQRALSQLSLLPVLRYGHCAFTQGEAVFAFYLMLSKATSEEPAILAPQLVLPDGKSEQEFQKLKEDYQQKHTQ